MAGAKLIVIYPTPTDIESFERVYHNQHVPMAAEKLAGKTKIVASKIVEVTARGTPLLSGCRHPFPHHGRSASVRGVGRGQTNDRQCRGDLFRRHADFIGR